MWIAVILNSACALAIALSSMDDASMMDPSVEASVARISFEQPQDQSFEDAFRIHCRRLLIGEKTERGLWGALLNARMEELCLKQHAMELAAQATATVRLTSNIHPNIYEASISPLERLHRLAIRAIKPMPPQPLVDLITVWQTWWDVDNPRIRFDERSVAERFYAYVTERQLGYIATTDDIQEFEFMLNRRILNSIQFPTHP